MKIGLAQLNPLIGDVAGNAQAIQRAVTQAREQGVRLVIFPEQSILGYPAKDLLLRREVIEANLAALETIASQTTGIAALVGVAQPNPAPHGRALFNAAALLADGRVGGFWQKRLLPTYDIFDEARYFQPGPPQSCLELDGLRIGVTICEDMLADVSDGRRLYDCDPAADLVARGARVLVNLSASPYVLGKHAWRLERLGEHARAHGVPVIWVNQAGGNDEILFDGASLVLDRQGRVAAQARAFAEDLLIVELGPDGTPGAGRVETVPEGVASLHAALTMGLRDYARKCGFRTAVVGLSGGIDSSVVGALAAEALGPQQVHGVAMPGRYSSPHSLEDARRLAANLGIHFRVIEIEAIHTAFERTLAPHFEGRPPDVTEENIQARIRGALLMALSNKFGHLLLSTGNKSELATGYCTLYGDMAGGLAVISDVPKMMVYQLGRYINDRAGRELIPQRVFAKAPSAELRPDQTDQDTLPPYPLLDAILERHEEHLESPEQIAAAGFDIQLVQRVLGMVHRSEYKRHQAAPGLKVTTRAFGFGRRMPIAARYPPR